MGTGKGGGGGQEEMQGRVQHQAEVGAEVGLGRAGQGMSTGQRFRDHGSWLCQCMSTKHEQRWDRGQQGRHNTRQAQTNTTELITPVLSLTTEHA